MNKFTLDQITSFLAVVDNGSFSSASKALGRTQPAISGSIQKFEEEVGAVLFDRSSYRPILTTAGLSLLPQIRRVAEDISALRLQAQGVTGEVESTLSIVIDKLCPMELISEPLQMLMQRYPNIQLKCYGRVLDDVINLFDKQEPLIGIMGLYGNTPPTFNRISLINMDFFMVAAPDHPLAKIDAPVSIEQLRHHVQLMVVDHSGLAGVSDYAVYSSNTWRFEQPSNILPLLRKGAGYGILPDHLIKDDIASGRLISLNPKSWEGGAHSIHVPIYATWRNDVAMGPAAQWFLNCLRETASS